MAWYFQRTGSCRVCVRALRQWRSRLPRHRKAAGDGRQRRLPVLDVLAGGFGHRIAEADTAQSEIVERSPLLFLGFEADEIDEAEMALRDLADARIGGGDDGEH